jgi:peptidoglycan/LPS O-acetylase OafA/YrhL
MTSAPRLGDVAQGRNNNFDLLRFLAASMVIVYHEYCVTGTPITTELVFRLTRGRDNFGALAVAVFFIISGFLVTQSFVRRDGRLVEFLSARALRIFPALWVAVPFTIIVSSFASALPWGKYLTHPRTLKFWLNDSILWNMRFALPGAFLHVPVAGDVNGSLWTLPTEFRMYLVCAGLGVLGIYASRAAFNALCLAVLMTVSVTRMEAIPFAQNDIHLAQWVVGFTIGAAFFVNREHIRLSIPVALLLLAATYPFRNQDIGRIEVLPAIAYATLCFCLHPALHFRPFHRIGDYSYGLYIYAFPLQQQMVFYHPGIGWRKGFLLTYPIILGTAILSWHFLEKPALGLKKYFHRGPTTSPRIQRTDRRTVPGAALPPVFRASDTNVPENTERTVAAQPGIRRE